MILKILSWNIWGGKYLPKVIDFLKTSNADIIALQEVVQDIDGKNNTAQIISEKLDYEWVYYSKGQTDFYRKVNEWGNAVLSNHKIIGSKVYNLSDTENRIAVEADVQVQNKVIHVFSTHLVHTHQKPSPLQELQAKNLTKILPKENTILMGDFNATPQSNTVKIVNQAIIDTDKEHIQMSWSIYPDGCVECNPGGLLNERLDYIFTSKDMKVKSFNVENSKGSDHLPISATIEI